MRLKSLTAYDSPAKCRGRPLNWEKVSKNMVKNAWTFLAASSVVSIVSPKSAYENPTPTLRFDQPKERPIDQGTYGWSRKKMFVSAFQE